MEIDPKGTFQVIDENENEISIPEFVKNYSKGLDHIKYFAKVESSIIYDEINRGMRFLYGDM
ncbi:MAG TPA: hypothetical protein VIP29_00955 [Nitrososphaeraceae archaeon]